MPALQAIGVAGLGFQALEAGRAALMRPLARGSMRVVRRELFLQRS